MAPTVLISLTCFLCFIFRWDYNLTKLDWLFFEHWGPNWELWCRHAF